MILLYNIIDLLILRKSIARFYYNNMYIAHIILKCIYPCYNYYLSMQHGLR